MIVQHNNNVVGAGLANAGAQQGLMIHSWKPNKRPLSEYKPDTVIITSKLKSSHFNGTKKHKLLFLSEDLLPTHKKPNMEVFSMDECVDTVLYPDGDPMECFRGELNHFSLQRSVIGEYEDLRIAGPNIYDRPEYIGGLHLNLIIPFLRSSDKALCVDNVFLKEMSYYGINIEGANPIENVKSYKEYVKELV